MASAEVKAPGARLEGLDRVLHIVVQKCKGDGLTSKGVRAAIKNLKYTANCEKKPFELVDVLLDRLVDEGLAVAVEEGPGRKRQKGRRVRQCRWKAWADIQGNPASDAFRARLGVGENDFA